MKRQIILTLLLLSLLTALPAHAAGFNRDKLFINKDKLAYGGYEISRELNEDEGAWEAVLRKDGKIVEVIEKGGPIKEMTQFGLHHFFNSKIPQLVVEQYSGGAHCCFSLSVFNLNPEFHILHQTEFPISGLAEIVDLDGDGNSEIVQGLCTFDYFDRLPHVYSPQALVIFSYDPQEKMYVPANQKYSAYLLKDIDRRIKAVKDYNAKTDFTKIKPAQDMEHLSKILAVILDYIYAGKEKEGWAFFDKEYRLSDKEEMRGKIKAQLEGDQVYEYVYGRL